MLCELPIHRPGDFACVQEELENTLKLVQIGDYDKLIEIHTSLANFLGFSTYLFLALAVAYCLSAPFICRRRNQQSCPFPYPVRHIVCWQRNAVLRLLSTYANLRAVPSASRPLNLAIDRYFAQSRPDVALVFGVELARALY